MLCLIDNYDSFTYNLVHYLEELNQPVQVIKNDEMPAKDVFDIAPDSIIISPGPGTPHQSGISKEVIELAIEKNIPVLGVCLGHELIGEMFGCKVTHAKKVLHGKISSINHKGSGPFTKLPKTFNVTRYHSLVLDDESIPDCLEVTAWSVDDGEQSEIMGISHKQHQVHGVQFHPESILTEHGHDLLNNYLNICNG